MHIVKASLLAAGIYCVSTASFAKTVPFELSIAGENIAFHKSLELSDVGSEHLLERIYFSADSLETVRESMYAGKYLDKKNGTFKLVFYPAMGQTEPQKESILTSRRVK